MAQLETEIAIACSAESLFAFVNDPSNRPRTSPPNVSLELVEVPDAFFEGCRFEFEIRAFGQRQRFLHEIVDWSQPDGFVERQLEGPFGEMEHVRRVEESGDGARLVEHVRFAPPGGLLGMMLTESRIRSMLADGFAHQHREMKRLLESAP